MRSSECFESKYSPTFFKKLSPINQLLDHVAHGEDQAVDAMLEKNPMLLLEKGNAIDHVNRELIDYTAYRAARSLGDLDIFNDSGKKVVSGMTEIIEKHFHRLPFSNEKNNELLLHQYNEQFPKGFEEYETKRIEDDKAALKRVWDVIKEAEDFECARTSEIDDDIQEKIWNHEDETLYAIDQSLLKASSHEAFEEAFNDLKNVLQCEDNLTVLKAIYQFRNHLEPKMPITHGFQCNYMLPQHALTLYEHDYAIFGNKELSPKIFLGWRKILGYIDRFLSPSDAQITAEGPLGIWDDKKKFQRSLNFRDRNDQSFPLDPGGIFRLGYNSAAGDGMMLATGMRGLCFMRNFRFKIIGKKEFLRPPTLKLQRPKLCCAVL